MKRSYHLIAITVIITNLFLHSMEVEMQVEIPNAEIIAGMTHILEPITNPAYVAFLDNNIVTIAGDNGFVFFDLATQHHTHHQEESKIDDFAINATKTKVATSCKGFLTVYNAQTQKSEWCYNTRTGVSMYTSITFNSQNGNQLFAHHFPAKMLLIDNAGVKKTEKTEHIRAIQQTPIACHPGGASVAYIGHEHASSKGTPQDNVRIFHMGNAQDCLIMKPLDALLSCEFSSNADYLLMHTDTSLILKEYLVEGDVMSFLHEPLYNYIASALHPNNKVFVTLASNNLLQYWSCKKVIEQGKTNRFLTFMPLTTTILFKESGKKEQLSKITKRIAFSSDGKYLIVALIDRCIVLPVPF